MTLALGQPGCYIDLSDL
jgi:hypothetical protein